MYRSSTFLISYFRKRKVEENKFVNKNIKFHISAFCNIETRSQKIRKIKKGQNSLFSTFRMVESGTRKAQKVNCEHVSSDFQSTDCGMQNFDTFLVQI